MNDPDRHESELDRLLRTAPAAIGSGVRSGVRGVVLFLAAGVAYGSLIGKIEELFYDFPYIALGLWLLTGIIIFRACERGDL
jgi:hypothetical protein